MRSQGLISTQGANMKAKEDHGKKGCLDSSSKGRWVFKLSGATMDLFSSLKSLATNSQCFVSF